MLAVTHDQGEAFALADRVVVMRDGRIAQAGTPLEVWQRPASEFVARFLGFDNVVEATVHRRGRGDAVGQGAGAGRAPRRGRAALLVRPAGVRLGDPADGLPCTVGARTFRGDHVAVTLRPEQRAAAGGGVRAAGRPPGGGEGRRGVRRGGDVVLPAVA